MSFADYPIRPPLLAALRAAAFLVPNPTQQACLRPALQGHSLLVKAQTGSGKTLCYLIPLLNSLLQRAEGLGLIVVPTRQLAIQVKQVAEGLSKAFPEGLRFALLIGGSNQMQQVVQLAKKPHVIIGCPGRIVDHLKGTRGFRLQGLKQLVLDEVDKLVGHEHIKFLEEIVRFLPKERATLMFSATINRKVIKLEHLASSKPTQVIEVQADYALPQGLSQAELAVKAKYRDCLLFHLLTTLHSKAIIFFQSCESAARLARLLTHLGLKTLPLTGKMEQGQRQKNMEVFREEQNTNLCTTDVAARGLDFTHVGCVINYDVPDPQNYVHRVGRTARNGKTGLALTLVTEYSYEYMSELRDKVEGIVFQQHDTAMVQQLYEQVTKANQEVRPARRLSEDQSGDDSDQVGKRPRRG